MILMKENNIEPSAKGMKNGSCRGIRWNQAKDGSIQQLRTDFNSVPFAWAKIGVKEVIDLNDMEDSFFIDVLGYKSKSQYMEEEFNQKDDSRRLFVPFEGIFLNPAFDWNKYGIDYESSVIATDSAVNFAKGFKSFIGKKCDCKGIFKTKKLTATAIINKIIEFYIAPAIKESYIAENEINICDCLEILIDCYTILGISPAEMWFNPDILPFSLGNDKIGEDTLCISVNTGSLCYMGILGKCPNYDTGMCYACNSNRMYTSELLKNTLSQLNFIQSDAETLAKETAKAVKQVLTKNQLANLKFLRFNVNGDILNDDQLRKLNRIAEILKKELNIFIAYSYTHNLDLNLSFASEIVFNISDASINGFKSCFVVMKWDASLMKDEYIICNGDCNRCSYCKNPKEGRKIIFLAHGGKYKGIEAIPEDIFEELTIKKELDYIKFCQEFGIPCDA